MPARPCRDSEQQGVPLPLVLGIQESIGFEAAYRAGGRVRLIYFDLHPDMNVPSSVPEGALDWMGTAHALGIDGTEPALFEVGPVAPLLRPDELWLFAYGPKDRTALRA